MAFDPFQRARELPTEEPPPERIGDCELLELIGEGGFGRVYRARDALGREVALKLLTRADERRLARFRREAETLARLAHPNVVAVHTAAEHDGLPYLVMELVEGGRTLADVAPGAERGERLRWLSAAARGVAHAHAQGVVHRDLKPTNVLIGPGPRVRVADFGLAFDLAADRLTRTGQFLGTPRYMAPEQGRKLEPEQAMRCDVWALGVLLYELLCDASPFPEGLLFTASASRAFPPPRDLDPTIPRALEQVCLRALAWESADRYADAGAFTEALAAASGAAGPRNRVALLAAGLVTFLALGLAVVLASRGPAPAPAPDDPAPPPPTPAPEEASFDLRAFSERRARCKGAARAEWFREAWANREAIRASGDAALQAALEASYRGPLHSEILPGAWEVRFLAGGSLAVSTRTALYAGPPERLRPLADGFGTFGLGASPQTFFVPYDDRDAPWLWLGPTREAQRKPAPDFPADAEYVTASAGPGGLVTSWIERTRRPPAVVVRIGADEVFRRRTPRYDRARFQDSIPRARWDGQGGVLFADGAGLLRLEPPDWTPRRLTDLTGITRYDLTGGRIFVHLYAAVSHEIFFDGRPPQALPGPTEYSRHHAFACDGEWLYGLAFKEGRRGRVTVWRASEEGWDLVRDAEIERPTRVTLSPDGALFVVTYERGLEWWAAGEPSVFRQAD